MKTRASLLLFLVFLLAQLGPVHARSTDLELCFKAFTDIQEVLASSRNRVLGHSEFKGFQGKITQSNEAFIQVAKAGNFEESVFLRLENKMMKLLNDRLLKNKGDSYSVSIGFQTLFLENLKRKYPRLYDKIHLRYHDYKSLNLGFRGRVNLSQLEETLGETQKEFAQLLARDLDDRGIEIVGRHSDFEKWMVAAWGKTPDEASLAAKLARGDEGGRLISFSEKRARALEVVEKKNSYWEYVRRNLHGENFYRRHAGDLETLDMEIVNLARKAQSKEQFILEFQEIHPRVAREAADAVYEYVKTIDELTASVLTPSTTSISPNQTTGIVYSVDIGQMGAEGFVETMKRINHLSDLDLIIKESRAAFWEADKKLKLFYEHVKKSFGDELDIDLIAHMAHTSGDDALFVFDDALKALKKERNSLLELGASADEISQINRKIQSMEDRWSVYREEGFDNYLLRVSEHPEAYRLRVTSVKPVYRSTGHEIPRKEVSFLIENAESAEKSLRKGLLKNPEVGVAQSKKILIGVETTALREGEIHHRLVVVNKSNIPQEKLEEIILNQYQSYIGDIPATRFKHGSPGISFLP